MADFYHEDRRVRRILRNVLRTTREGFRDFRWLIAELNRLIIEKHEDLFDLDEATALPTEGGEIIAREFEARYTLDAIIHGPQPSAEDEAEIRLALVDAIAEEIRALQDCFIPTGVSIRPVGPILINYLITETEFEFRTLAFKTMFGVTQKHGRSIA